MSFILPAVLLTTALAWVYVQFGALPQVAPFLYGIKPVVLAIILTALWRLGKTALRKRHRVSLLVIGLAVASAALLGLNGVIALLLGGLVGMLWLIWLDQHKPSGGGPALMSLAGVMAGGNLASTVSGLRPRPLTVIESGVPLWELGLFFLKIGAVLYGSGYVLVAFLEGELVHDLGWLTQQQLLDAIAIGQFTPGPVLSTSAFIGYLIAGAPGAAVAAVAIFLPSFFFVAILNPLIPRLRRSQWTSAFLDAVNVSAVALMVAVLIRLAQVTLTSWPSWVIFLAAAVASFRWKINAAWLVLGGALAGCLLSSWMV